MKKQISMTLAVIVFALSLASCSGTGKDGIGWKSGSGSSGGSGGTGSHTGSGNSGSGKNKDSDTDSYYFYPGEPEYDFSDVESEYRLHEYHLDTVDVPWGETHGLHMVNGQIQNYFRYTAFDYNNEFVCNKDLYNISTTYQEAFPWVNGSAVTCMYTPTTAMTAPSAWRRSSAAAKPRA